MEKLDLNGVWSLQQAGEEKKYQARIPGSVLSAFLEEKAIPDPYYGRNEYQARDLFWNDYEFFRKFEVEEDLLKEENLELVCLGIDTLADIYVNGELVFHVDNMHRTWRIPVKEYLHAGKNEIRIFFPSVLKYMENYSYAENKEVKSVPCGTMRGNHLVRKSHSMFGWDWGPQLPDAGIFRDIYIEGYTGRRIEDIRFIQRHKKMSVELTVKVTFVGKVPIDQDSQQISVVVKDRQTGEVKAETNEPYGSGNRWEKEFSIDDPKLWWPNGYGEQPLYQVEISLEDSDGKLLEEHERTIGLRTMEVSREKDAWGREFAFVVNGLKIFAMGADYIPEDCIYSHITRERQEYLLDCALRAHFNCVRVWGGGYYPSDDFYEMCDEKGLIVWQDLMFACNVYDVTNEFMESCRQEIIDNVKRLRHHASLGLWCGNNEIESGWDHWEMFQEETMQLRADYIKLFEHMIPGVMRETDPDTFFWPSSPSAGGCFANPDDENDGDAHYWDVWHGQKPFTDYRKYYFRFCSEFGFQSFPGMKTVKTFADQKDLNIFSRVMESHQKNDSANGKMLYYLSENFRYPSRFEDILYVSQVLQGMSIQYGTEHWRRNRGRCMGAIYWQFNDVWPAPSWSSVDYFGRWKALQYMACRFFAPVTSSIIKEDDKVCLYMENESKDQVSWKGEILLKNMDCEVIHKVTAQGSTDSYRSEKILDMEIGEMDRLKISDPEEYVFFEGRVFFEDGRASKNIETVVPFKYLQLKQPKIKVSVEETVEGYDIILSSHVFAAFVELDFEDADVIFSDNYFHITEKEPYRVQLKKEDIRNGEFQDGEDVRKRLKVRSVADTYLNNL